MNTKYLKKLIEAKPRYQMPLLLKSKIKNAQSDYKSLHHSKSIQSEIRENQLNSKFLKRKKRLENISFENKHIYNKINTQKSFYGNEDLNKSYRSTEQISKRLSRLRARSRQNSISRISRENSEKQKIIKPYIIPPKPPVVCQTINVNLVKQDNINHLKSLFIIEKQNRQLVMKQRKTESMNSNYPRRAKQNAKKHYEQKYKLPYLSDNNTTILTQRNLNKFQNNIKKEKDIKCKSIFQNLQRRASLFDKKVRELFSK